MFHYPSNISSCDTTCLCWCNSTVIQRQLFSVFKIPNHVKPELKSKTLDGWNWGFNLGLAPQLYFRVL